MYIDPVCGAEVDEEDTEWTSVYNGVTYYFCCRSCLESFEADPELFLSDFSLDEEDLDVA